MKAFLKQTRISPKKVNLVAELARNKKASEAVDILKFTPKKSAKVLMKLIESAIANAENNFKQKASELMISEIIVNEGPTLKRSLPVSRGRTHPILKRTSHITVKLVVFEEKSETAKEKKAESKPKNTKSKSK